MARKKKKQRTVYRKTRPGYRGVTYKKYPEKPYQGPIKKGTSEQHFRETGKSVSEKKLKAIDEVREAKEKAIRGITKAAFSKRKFKKPKISLKKLVPTKRLQLGAYKKNMFLGDSYSE